MGFVGAEPFGAWPRRRRDAVRMCVDKPDVTPVPVYTGRRVEEIGELGLVVPPATDGAAIDAAAVPELKLAVRTGRLVLVELEAGRLPLQAAGVEKPPCDRLEIVDRFLVVDLVNGCGQDLPASGSSAGRIARNRVAMCCVSLVQCTL